jgi:hypothetical protein
MSFVVSLISFCTRMSAFETDYHEILPTLFKSTKCNNSTLGKIYSWYDIIKCPTKHSNLQHVFFGHVFTK